MYFYNVSFKFGISFKLNRMHRTNRSLEVVLKYFKNFINREKNCTRFYKCSLWEWTEFAFTFFPLYSINVFHVYNFKLKAKLIKQDEN